MPEETPAVKARLIDEDRVYAVELRLSGHFQPIDGRFHWGGRMSAGPEVVALLRSGRRDVFLAGTAGEAPVAARLVELDPWGGIRVTGIGPPPFVIDASDFVADASGFVADASGFVADASGATAGLSPVDGGVPGE
jgi:hypothetical protein